MFDSTSSIARESSSVSSAPVVTVRPIASLPTTAARAPRIDSHRLLSSGRELVIDHAGQEYRLRLTRNYKLILTK